MVPSTTGEPHDRAALPVRSGRELVGGWLRSRPALWVCAALAALALAGGVATLGSLQFGGEDGGIVAASGYMMHLGYEPYVEVAASGLPPAFLYGAKWAFDIGGVSWGSLVLFTAVFVFGTFLAHVWLLERLGLGPVAAIGLAVLSQVTTMLPISWWWSNQVTSVLAALFVTAALVFVTRPEERASRAALVVTAIALSWAKPNVAGLLLLGASLAFLFDRRTRKSGLLLLLASGVGSLLLMILVGIDPRALIDSYREASARVSQGGLFQQYLWENDHNEAVRTLLSLIPAGLALLVATATAAVRRQEAPERSPRLPYALVCLAAIATGVVAMGTNNDHNLVETPAMLIAAVGLSRLLMPRESVQRTIRVAAFALLAGSVLFLSILGVRSAIGRTRIASIGPGAFYEESDIRALTSPRPLAGLRTGVAFREVQSEIGTVLALDGRAGDPYANVFFGPRLLVDYPAWGVRPPKGLPLWWQLYQDGRPQTAEAVDRFDKADFPLAIFLRDDFTFYPPSLMALLLTKYDAYYYGRLSLLVAKDAHGVTVPRGATRMW